jgi:hypothetical protein
VATTLLSKETRIHSAELILVAKRAKATLCESSKKFGDEAISNTAHEIHPLKHESILDSDDALMKEQLNFISKLTADIDKTTKALID